MSISKIARIKVSPPDHEPVQYFYCSGYTLPPEHVPPSCFYSDDIADALVFTEQDVLDAFTAYWYHFEIIDA